ncbi:MAG: prepilin-type N-terminal cleavage/methylation domain-containing protein [Neisseria sp.]|nr:prepilin-type N-terminal cleavage/methylation domain-containing protein [Neisseria sp.]
MLIRTKKGRKQPYFPTINRQAGFSLIEFLVASALSMIVLMAAGSGFFTTQRLNNVASGRLQVQQDLRMAANMIVRDARMAGSFGCFNLAKQSKSVSIASDGQNNDTSLTELKFKNQNQGVKLMPISSGTRSVEDLKPGGFTFLGSNILLFNYGIGSSGKATLNGNTLTVQGDQELAELSGHSTAPVVISSCSALDRLVGVNKNYSGGDLKLSASPLTVSSKHKVDQISVFRQIVNVYTIGQPDKGEVGLYLFQLNADGTWSDPQLLISGVNAWDIQLGYLKGCSAGVNDATFEIEDKVRANADAIAPTLLHIQLLNGNQRDIQTKGNSGNVSDVQSYNIDATIRGGNACADRNIQEAV